MEMNLVKYSIRSLAVAVIILIATSSLQTLALLESIDYPGQHLDAPLECKRLYFFNGIMVYGSRIKTALILETPRNTSLGDSLVQIVYHISWLNLKFDNTLGSFYFEVETSRSYKGFFLSMIDICFVDYNATLTLIRDALKNPRHGPAGDIPAWIKSIYVRRPSPVILEKVLPEYEAWFYRTYGFSVQEASLLGIAVTVGYFIMNVFINYSADPLPKSIDEVVETRRGDCDDMSRVVVQLLNHYGIPALIASGFVYAPPLGNITVSVGNTTYIFSSNGPHAFPMAYIPSYGWLSLDFLAGSFIQYPMVIDSFTIVTDVARSDVEEFVELHRSIDAIQILVVMSEDDYKRLIGGEGDIVEALNRLMDDYISTVVTNVRNESQITQADDTNESQITQADDTYVAREPAGEFNMVFEVFIGLSVSLIVAVLLITKLLYRSMKR